MEEGSLIVLDELLECRNDAGGIERRGIIQHGSIYAHEALSYAAVRRHLLKQLPKELGVDIHRRLGLRKPLHIIRNPAIHHRKRLGK